MLAVLSDEPAFFLPKKRNLVFEEDCVLDDGAAGGKVLDFFSILVRVFKGTMAPSRADPEMSEADPVCLMHLGEVVGPGVVAPRVVLLRPSEARTVDVRLLCITGVTLSNCDFISGVLCRLGRAGGAA